MRKIIHLLTAVIPVVYIFLNRFPMVVSLTILFTIAVIVDLLRLKSKNIGRFFTLHLGELLWEKEHHTLTGATTYAISAFLSVYLFDKWIAIAVLLFLSLGDTAAYFVGYKWGITYLNSEKTIEGSAACLVVCLTVSMILPKPEMIILISGSVFAALIELFPLGVDDNLALPLISGVGMEIILKQLGTL